MPTVLSRTIVALAVVVVVAGAASANTGDPMVLGTANTATSTTQLTAGLGSSPVLKVLTSGNGTGPAIQGVGNKNHAGVLASAPGLALHANNFGSFLQGDTAILAEGGSNSAIIATGEGFGATIQASNTGDRPAIAASGAFTNTIDSTLSASDSGNAAVAGTATNAIGVHGSSTSGTGVFGASGSGRSFQASGGTAQNLADGGWAKVLLQQAGGALTTCFEGVLSGNPANSCADFSIVKNGTGNYTVTLPYDVGNRFVFVTVISGATPCCMSQIDFPAVKQVRVRTWDNTGTAVDRAWSLAVL